MLIIYYIIYVIVLWLIYHFYFCYTNKFWCKQPVFHYHYLNYWVVPPKVIWKSNFPIMPYYSPYITHSQIEQLSKETIHELHKFINDYFYNSKEGYYKPTVDSIFKQFSQSDYICYDKIDSKMTSCIFSKALTMNHKGTVYPIHYIDYLCTHPSFRGKGLTQKLIYTIACNNNKIASNKVYLFKKEYNLQSFIPLTKYISRCYRFNTNLLDDTHETIAKLHRVLPEDFSQIASYIENVERNVVISYNETAFFSILKNENIIYYLIQKDNTNVGLIGLRNSHSYYNNEKNKNNGLSIEVFCAHFCEFLSMKEIQESFYNILTDVPWKFDYVLVEGICDGDILIDIMNSQNDTFFDTTFAYYLYNFADYTNYPKDCLIIS